MPLNLCDLRLPQCSIRFRCTWFHCQKCFFAQIFILQDVNVQIPRLVSYWAELARQRHNGFVFPFKPWKWTTFSSLQCCRVSSDMWALKSVGITDILLVMTSWSSRWSWNDIHEAAMFVVEQASSQGGREINCTCASWVQHHVWAFEQWRSANFEFMRVVLKSSESAWSYLRWSEFKSVL